MTDMTSDKPMVLVVEDDKNQQQILVKMLGNLDIQIVVASSGQEALSLLLRHKFSLALIDVKMPAMGGFELVSLMRNNEESKYIPIIFMTAFKSDEVEVLKGYELGAIDYLFKPINKDILINKIEMFLRFVDSEKQLEREKAKMLLLDKIEKKNRELINAQNATLNMMEDANEAIEKLRMSENELRKTNADLQQFAYVATHDLRAPIINMQGFWEILKNESLIPDKDPEAIRLFESNLHSLASTLDDLILIISAGKDKKADISKNNIPEIVEEILDEFSLCMKEHNIKIEKKLGKLKYIDYPAADFRSIVSNLINNAIKYRHAGREHKIVIKASKQDEFVCIAVEDNGTGIQEKDKKNVFELYKRGDTKTEGKGLGLYLSKRQIESLGGNLSFDTEYGIGTTFTACFVDQKK